MRRIATMLAALATGLMPTAAMADAAGLWHVTRSISGRSFVVDCRFATKGSQLGGTCVDIATGDPNAKPKTHDLTSGSVNGNDVRWSYPITVLFFAIDVDFHGMMAGDRISGEISAKGRSGNFTAVRK